MNIEPIWYEGSPYVYAGVGVASLSNYQSYIAILSGIVLLTASVTIIRMRWVYRKLKAIEREQQERMTRASTRSKLRQNSRLMLDDEDEAQVIRRQVAGLQATPLPDASAGPGGNNE